MLLSYRGSLYGTVKYSEILKIGVGNIVFKIISCKIVVDNGVYFGYRLIYLTCDHIVICGISFGKRLSMKDLQREGGSVPAIIGLARIFPCFAFPWISGTSGGLFLGGISVISGRFIPCFDISFTMLLRSEAYLLSLYYFCLIWNYNKADFKLYGL